MFTDLIVRHCFYKQMPDNERIGFIFLNSGQATSAGMKVVSVTRLYTGFCFLTISVMQCK
jgi:hypothetical protein